MDYYTKYLKYKKKYLNIKKQKGGLIQLDGKIYEANLGRGYLISPVIDVPNRTNFNILALEKGIVVSNTIFDTYRRLNIYNIEEVYNKSWSQIYHTYGNTLDNNILFDIFQYGLYMWDLHYIFYNELLVRPQDPFYINTDLHLIMDCDISELSLYIGAYSRSPHKELIEKSMFNITMNYNRDKDMNQKFIPRGKLQIALSFYLGQYMKNIIKNINLQKLGIAFQRLKIINEKIGQFMNMDLEMLLNNIQTMIYYHIETQFKNIKKYIYEQIDKIEDKRNYELNKDSSQFDFLTPENKEYLEIISIQNPSFYDEEDICRVILTNIDIFLQPIEDISLFAIPPKISEELNKK